MATTQDTITAALRELGIIDIVETPAAELSTLSLAIINRILDDWNAERGAVYADVHTTPVALVAGTNPHTIGPSAATFTASPSRPVSIEGIRLTTDNGETYLPPLERRDAAWWHARATPGTQSDYPTDFYYDPTWPNGSIYFWPEPGSAAVKAQLWYRIVVSALAAADTLTLPPGYQSALHETLKERLTDLPMFKSLASADLKDAARAARGRAFGNNTTVPPLATDSGLGGGCRTYDYRTGPYSLMGR